MESTTVVSELSTKADVGKVVQVSCRQVENLVRSGKLPQPMSTDSVR